MKVTVRYGERTFGGNVDMPDYQVDVRSAKPKDSQHSVSLNFKFDSPVDGRGVGYNQGQVHGAMLGMSADHARQLAVAILWALEQRETATVLSLSFGKSAEKG